MSIKLPNSPNSLSKTRSAFLINKQNPTCSSSLPKKLTLFPSSKKTPLKFWQTSKSSFKITATPQNVPLNIPALQSNPSPDCHMSRLPINFGENNQEKEMKNDIESLDNWVFQHISQEKYSKETFAPKLLIEKALKEHKSYFLPELDVRLLNQVLYESETKIKTVKSVAENPNSLIPNKKIAVTCETINREYNKNLMIGLIQKKLIQNPVFKNCNQNYLFMVSKSILLEFVSSFQVLQSFRHQNVLHLKTQLINSSDQLLPTNPEIPSEASFLQKNPKSFESYERALKDSHLKFSNEIKSLKTRLSKDESLLKLVLTTINHRVDRLQDLIKQKDSKETQSVFLRKFGKSIGIQEYSAINELKRQIEIEESEISTMKIDKNLKEEKMKLFSEKICQEIEALKFKKHLFGIKLKEFYFNLIFCEEDLGKYGKSLIEIVTLLFRFNWDLKPVHFSKFYSPLDMDFVRKYAKMAIWANNLKCQNKENQGQLVHKHGLLLKQIHEDQHVGQVQVIKSAISKLKQSHLRVYEKNSLGRPKSISLKWELRLSHYNNYPKINRDVEGINENEEPGLANNKKVNEVSVKLTLLKQEYIKGVVAKLDNGDRCGVSGPNMHLFKKKLTLVFGPKDCAIVLSQLKEKWMLK